MGIGAGWAEDEYNSFGFPSPYPSAPVRIKQLEEALITIKLMWTNSESTFSGQYYSIKGAICYPKPLQIPRPTIMVGGSGERYLLKVVADRYNIPFTPSLETVKNNALLHNSETSLCRNAFNTYYEWVRYGLLSFDRRFQS